MPCVARDRIAEPIVTRAGIFISHIHTEKTIALVLQKYLRATLGNDVPIFVSSDRDSVGGGRKWFSHITDNLRNRSVVICLVSQESKHREWINFEAGFGDGNGACVIPVAVMD